MIVTILAAILAAGGCTHGSEFDPPSYPTHLPQVVAVRIEAQGVSLWSETEEGPPCSNFRLSIADVRRFFRSSRWTEAHDVHMTLPQSPCVVRGSAKFADGSRGEWTIDRFGLSTLGYRGDHMTLYCRACRQLPWMQ